jgi:hypothetical protein
VGAANVLMLVPTQALGSFVTEEKRKEMEKIMKQIDILSRDGRLDKSVRNSDQRRTNVETIFFCRCSIKNFLSQRHPNVTCAMQRRKRKVHLFIPGRGIKDSKYKKISFCFYDLIIISNLFILVTKII